MNILFTNARLILDPSLGVVNGSIRVTNGLISEVVLPDRDSKSSILEGVEVIDCEGDYLSAGLVDQHCHGAMGSDAMEANGKAFGAILRYHASRGTTTMALSTVAASWEEMFSVLICAERYSGEEVGEARLAGIHLEGPYFSPLRRGAHRAEMLRYPTPDETRLLINHAGVIRRLTLAPELPGALHLVSELAARGVAMSAGHSDASLEEAAAGFSAGISQVTHLFNCMSSLHSKQGIKSPGLAEAALETPGVVCEVIADGIHLSGTTLRLSWLAKGWEELILVSDATAGAGLSEGAFFQLGGLPCKIEGGAAWTGEGPDQRLAGSTATLIDGIRVMVDEAGVPIAEAVAMATSVPAQSLGLSSSIGSLKVGKHADLLRFSSNWMVKGVWIGGRSTSC